MSSITVFLADNEGNGLPDQTVWLRRKGLSNFGANAYLMSNVTGEPGSYKYSGGHVTDTYKVWVNGSEDKSYGGDDGIDIIRIDDVLLKAGGTMTGDINMDNHKITNLPDPATDTEPVKKGYGDGRYLGKAGGTMTGDINMDNHKITNLPDPATDTEPVKKGYGDGRYLGKAGGTMTGDLNMGAKKILGLPEPASNEEPLRVTDGASRYIGKAVGISAQEVRSVIHFLSSTYVHVQPTNLLQIANRKFVEDYVNLYMQGLVTTDQQSGNILRVLFSGTQENNRVYTTMESALSVASEYASEDREMILLVEGAGVDGAVSLNYNLITPGTIDPFIHIVGINRSVVLRAAEDNYTAGGNNIVSTVMIDNENEDASTTFEELTFINVHFKNSFGSGSPSYIFERCRFFNCSYDGVAVTANSCKGELFDSGNNRKRLLCDVLSNNDFTVINQSGDLRGRRILGRVGADVASGLRITLGNGNYFLVTGTTGISYINKTDWEAGSVITLEFGSNLTVQNAEMPDLVTDAGLIFKSGADKNILSGQLYRFILNRDKNYWLEI